jgi:hypothetical protein
MYAASESPFLHSLQIPENGATHPINGIRQQPVNRSTLVSNVRAANQRLSISL